MVKTYNKLVRDRIPEIIESSGKTCLTATLSDESYIHMLDLKLNEELTEYQESKSMEELADLLEVIGTGFQIVGSYSAVNVSSIILLLSHAVFVQLEHGAFDRRTIVVLEYDLKDALGFLCIAVQFNRYIRTVFLIA